MAEIVKSKPKAIKVKTGATKLFLSTDQYAQEVPRELVELCQEIAKQEEIPITGLTILGGKPYINVTGLDRKLRNKCEKENLILINVKAEKIQHATEENKYKAGYRGIVQFFNEKGFLEALGKLSSPDIATIEKLKEVYTYSFEDEGWASPQSVKMSTLHSTDAINMMASRRATNRAKRLATGCGLTSIDELGIEITEMKQEVPSPEKPTPISDIEEKLKKMRKLMFKNAREVGITLGQVRERMKERFSKTSSKDLTENELKEMLQWLEEQKVSSKEKSDTSARDLINEFREAQDVESLKQIKRDSIAEIRQLAEKDKAKVDEMYRRRMQELKQIETEIEEEDDE